MNKIFDFNEKKIPGGIIGRPRELAWPCEMFRITLPKSNRDINREFNAFERCVLKLLAYGRYEPKDLAVETCLPSDLIEVILLRLYDYEKIDEHYQVLPDTLKAIEKYDTEKESEPAEYETYVIFRECVGGTLLPMLKEANLRSEEVNEDGDIVEGGKTIRLWHLRALQRHTFAPATADVLSAVRIMSRRSKASGEYYHIPHAKFVSVASDSEPCKLHVRMVLQRNSDWRILNPFGKGWSLELESVYPKLLEERETEAKSFQDWQNSNRNDRSTQCEEDNNRKLEPYDTPKNRSRYPELLATLNRKDVDVYAALEWTLFYALQKVDTKKIIQLLHFDSQENNEKCLASAVSRFAGDKNLIRIPLPGKLQSFQNDEMAEMQVVLPLTILVSQDDPKFSFHKVIQAYPDFLSRIFYLKKRRDAKRHAKSPWSKIYGDEDYVFMQNVVTTLLPSIRFSDSPSTLKSEDDTSTDIRLDARIALQNIFGVFSFDRMDNILQENLLQVEIFRQTSRYKTGFDALPCINHLYAAVQCAFRTLPVSERPAIATIKTAEQKAKDAGWGDLPVSLCTVRQDMLQKTLDGNDQTLGACVVAWLLLTDGDLLQPIAVKLPSFLSDVDSLLTLNGHANQACMMQEAELESCIKTIYKIIRTIMEA